MYFKSAGLSIVIATVAAAFAASPASAETIEVHGSTTVSNNLLLPKKADFEKATGFELQIVGNGSGRGLTDLIEGKVKLAMISAPLADEVKSLKAKGTAVDESKLKAYRVGSAISTFAVHPSNSVKSVSPAQMADVLSGKITNWKELGGADKPIVVVCESKGGGVRSMVEKEYLGGGEIAANKREVPNAPQAVKIVAQVDAALGIVAKASLTADVAELDGGKQVVQPLILVTLGEPDPSIAKLIDVVKAAGGGA
jgi:phosphate transport system substrate-binding protein